jgi:hypothetical protein
MMTSQGQDDPYSSIFLEENWAHQKFYGWRVLQEVAFLRILEKRVGPLTRSLILARATQDDCGRQLVTRQLVARQGQRGPLHETVLHDFSASSDDHEWLRQQGFHPAGDSERLLNTATFVIDLHASPETLMQAMSSDCRRKIRKAIAGGTAVRVLRTPDSALLNDFVRHLHALSRAKGFHAPGLHLLQAMYAGGCAVLFVVEDAGGTLGYLHVYLAGPTGLFMYGVMLQRHNDGAGQFLHWQIMLWLQKNGYRWYDLGGLANQSVEDGIYRFKAGFGGELIQLGTEWVKRGAAYHAASGLRHALARIGRRDSSP